MNEPDSNNRDQAPMDPAAAPRPSGTATFGVRTAALAGQFIAAATAAGIGLDIWTIHIKCSSTTSPTFG